MDAFAKQIAKQIKDKYPNEEDSLQVANKILGQLIGTTHIQKVHGGGLAELEACRAIGLKWVSEDAHGADAFDKDGRRVELKCTGVKSATSKTAGKCNINYKFPENVDIYMHFAHSREYAGGHYWVIMNANKTEVRWWVHIPQQHLANYVREYIPQHPGKMAANFGSTLCRKCRGGGCNRFDEIRGQDHTCSSP